MIDPAQELPLPHRLDHKPIVFMGLTWTEVNYAIAISLIMSAFIGLVAGALMNYFKLILICMILVTPLLFLAIGKFMQRIKHNVPEGFYKQKIKITLQKMGFTHTYILVSGYRDPR